MTDKKLAGEIAIVTIHRITLFIDGGLMQNMGQGA
jgi:hypothetical protein